MVAESSFFFCHSPMQLRGRSRLGHKRMTLMHNLYSALPQVYVRVHVCACDRCGFLINFVKPHISRFCRIIVHLSTILAICCGWSSGIANGRSWLSASEIMSHELCYAAWLTGLQWIWDIPGLDDIICRGSKRVPRVTGTVCHYVGVAAAG